MKAEGLTIGQKLSKELQHLPFNLENFEHACWPRLETIVKRNGSIKYKLTGLHWDEGRQLEKLGFLKMENLKELAGGIYEADIWIYKGYKESKTFFPSTWSFDKLLSKIQEACCNLERTEVSLKDGVRTFTGRVSEGFYIVVKIDKQGKFVTAYPLDKLKIITLGA